MTIYIATIWYVATITSYEDDNVSRIVRSRREIISFGAETPLAFEASIRRQKGQLIEIGPISISKDQS